MTDIQERIHTGLSTLDRVFHRETDFQIGLAQVLELAIANGRVRPEVRYPLANSEKSKYVDLVIFTPEERVGIELKYPTAEFTANATPVADRKENPATERFGLKSVGAYDLAMYPFWNDVGTLESLVDEGHLDRGFMVQLTNFEGCWKKDDPGNNGAEFYLTEGREVSGRLDWSADTAQSTRDDSPPIDLDGTYHLSWEPYDYSYPSNPSGETEFKYLCLEVQSS